MTTGSTHQRRSVRLREYDYSLAGAYFVTICTWERECRFGEVVNGVMRMNETGDLVQECWLAIPYHFDLVEFAESVVMPNHVHGIVIIIDPEPNITGTTKKSTALAGTACRAPTVESFGKPVAGSLPTIVRSFKSAVTKRINITRDNPGGPVWQRNYYEHVIRNEADYHRIAEYIESNPARWAEDPLHPSRNS